MVTLGSATISSMVNVLGVSTSPADSSGGPPLASTVLPGGVQMPNKVLLQAHCIAAQQPLQTHL